MKVKFNSLFVQRDQNTYLISFEGSSLILNGVAYRYNAKSLDQNLYIDQFIGIVSRIIRIQIIIACYLILSGMQGLELGILSIECFNIFCTIIFLILFFFRLRKLWPIAVTNKYIDRHWWIRFFIAMIYIIISAVMLTIELIHSQNNDWSKNLLSSGSLGFCINSLILILHVTVLNLQFKRQYPLSKLHHRFLVYLFFICCIRLGVSVAQIISTNSNADYKIILGLTCLEVLFSLVMLIYWWKLRNALPFFDDVANMDMNVVTEKISTQRLLDNNSRNTDKISVQRWNLIMPTVSFELGKARIILQTFVDDDILKSLAQQQTKTHERESMNYKSLATTRENQSRPNQHLQIISDRHYSKHQLQKIYFICARFNLYSKIDFEGTSEANFFRQIQRYILQLFSIKQVYVHQILSLFYIDRESINNICYKVDKMIKSKDQLVVSTFIDTNSLFLSVEIFKQMWSHDHFIFYIHTVSIDDKDRGVCYKRYSDFEEFHSKLQDSVNLENKGIYLLPSLPKKHFFLWGHVEEEKITARRKELQNYCRETFNDYQIMTRMPTAREMIFEFMELKNTIEITPATRKAMDFYDGLEISKKNICKDLVEGEYITFYEFELFKNGIPIRSIYKRFREFIKLHQSISRWMENSQILYKFIQLPERHLYNSESKRHQKLKAYLKGVISIKDIYKIYAVNQFFNMGKRHDIENNGFGMSIIQRKLSEISQNQNEPSIQKIVQQNNKLYDFGAQSSQKQRMSLLIEQLGD